MFYSNEITEDFLDELQEKNIPFPYSGVAQFIPIDDTKFKIVSLRYDGSWDSWSHEYDISEAELYDDLYGDSDEIRTNDSIRERILNLFYDFFKDFFTLDSELLFSAKYFIDKTIFNFSNAYNELKEWIRQKDFLNFAKAA